MTVRIAVSESATGELGRTVGSRVQTLRIMYWPPVWRCRLSAEHHQVFFSGEDRTKNRFAMHTVTVQVTDALHNGEQGKSCAVPSR